MAHFENAGDGELLQALLGGSNSPCQPDHHPLQIRSVDAMWPGMLVEMVGRDGSATRLGVLALGMRHVGHSDIEKGTYQDPGWFIAARSSDDEVIHPETHSFADTGVISYPDGTWNATNYLRLVHPQPFGEI